MTNQLVLLEPDLFEVGAAGRVSASLERRAPRHTGAGVEGGDGQRGSAPRSGRLSPPRRMAAPRSGMSRSVASRRNESAKSGDEGGRRPEFSLDDGNDYHLDEHTREVGRAGLAAARRALAEAVRRSESRSMDSGDQAAA